MKGDDAISYLHGVNDGYIKAKREVFEELKKPCPHGVTKVGYLSKRECSLCIAEMEEEIK